MRFAFEAKTHFPGARFSVHPWWRRAPGKCVFVASNPEGISETRAPYTYYLLVVDRVYPNPKTRRVLGIFSKPEETRTRTFEILQYPNPIKPEILFQYETR